MQFSSLKTNTATAVTCYQDKDFKGKSAVFSGAVVSFGDFNDKVPCATALSGDGNSHSQF